jgi:uncharacterized repeat protein (TIGR04138 family)
MAMEEKKDFYELIEEICAADARYKHDAYDFLMEALYYTQKKLSKESHVTGRELLEGARSLIIEKYGAMAKTVLSHWGITKTIDFGNIVFNLIEKKLLSKTETDSLEDFKEVYDFQAAFGNILRELVIKNL